MLLGAIDIGSNAIRLQIVRVMGKDDDFHFKKAEYIRFPLRLGKDVFKEGKITETTKSRFLKLMHAFKLLLDLYEVEDRMAVATSAMREAANGKEIVKKVKEELGLNIEIIDGELEAEIISRAIIPTIESYQYVHIDVGGGSTEINLYVDREKKRSKSFRIGTVRKITKKEEDRIFNEMKDWIQTTGVFSDPLVYAIGTGGNIGKLNSLSNVKGKYSMSLTELQALQAYISTFKYEQRISDLKMNPDRADVIIPASNIYIRIMKIIKADQIFVPGVGLKDGVIYTLYNRKVNKQSNHIRVLKEDHFS